MGVLSIGEQPVPSQHVIVLTAEVSYLPQILAGPCAKAPSYIFDTSEEEKNFVQMP